jgi:hypothetical protein
MGSAIAGRQRGRVCGPVCCSRSLPGRQAKRAGPHMSSSTVFVKPKHEQADPGHLSRQSTKNNQGLWGPAIATCCQVIAPGLRGALDSITAHLTTTSQRSSLLSRLDSLHFQMAISIRTVCKPRHPCSNPMWGRGVAGRQDCKAINGPVHPCSFQLATQSDPQCG